MFCDGCGTQLQSNQQHCSGCGKAITGAIVGYPLRSRLQEHVRLLSILWFAFSAFEVIMGMVLLILANTVFARMIDMPDAPRPAAFLHVLFTFLGVFVLGKAVAGILAGWGLLNREPWGRVLALVLGFLALIHPPLGTALGIYTLWVLLPAKSEAEYARYRSASAA